MGATSVTGVSGAGSSEAYNKGPGNNRNIYQPLTGTSIVAAGEVFNEGCWQTLVQFPALAESPDNYVITVTQSDWSNNDGAGHRPPHVEKLDQDGYNSEYWYCETGHPWGPNSKLGGFVLHGGSDCLHKYGWMIVKVGGAFSVETCY